MMQDQRRRRRLVWTVAVAALVLGLGCGPKPGAPNDQASGSASVSSSSAPTPQACASIQNSRRRENCVKAAKPDSSSRPGVPAPTDALGKEFVADAEQAWVSYFGKLQPRLRPMRELEPLYIPRDTDKKSICLLGGEMDGDDEGMLGRCGIDDPPKMVGSQAALELYGRVGKYALKIVVGHEYGHELQYQSGFEKPPGDAKVNFELNADCVGGAYIQALEQAGADVPSDETAEGLFTLATSLGVRVKHPPGTRLAAFNEGRHGGIRACMYKGKSLTR